MITILGTNRTRDVNRDMDDYIPKYYGDFPVATNITAREATELENYYNDIKDVLDQLFVDTATWGLSRWEKIAGIPSDETKSDAKRRSSIKSKLRGKGTVTLAMFKNTGNSFYEVDVKEDYVNYQITVVIIGERGEPDNLSDLETAIKEIIPAHLAYLFEFTYLPWDELEGALLTFNDTDTYTWDGLETTFL